MKPKLNCNPKRNSEVSFRRKLYYISTSLQDIEIHTVTSVAKLVDALDLGSSKITCESSSLSTRRKVKFYMVRASFRGLIINKV